MAWRKPAAQGAQQQQQPQQPGTAAAAVPPPPPAAQRQQRPPPASRRALPLHPPPPASPPARRHPQGPWRYRWPHHALPRPALPRPALPLPPPCPAAHPAWCPHTHPALMAPSMAPSMAPTQHGLAGAGGPHQQHPLGQLAPQARELLGVLQVRHNLLQLPLRLIHPLHVSKLGLGVRLGPAAASSGSRGSSGGGGTTTTRRCPSGACGCQQQQQEERRRRRHHQSGAVVPAVTPAAPTHTQVGSLGKSGVLHQPAPAWAHWPAPQQPLLRPGSAPAPGWPPARRRRLTACLGC